MAFVVLTRVILKVSKFFCTFLGERHADVLFLVVVEVAGISWPSTLWYERSFHLQDRKGNDQDVKKEKRRGSSRVQMVVMTQKTVQNPQKNTHNK